MRAQGAVPAGMKRCYACEQTKEGCEFAKDRSRKDGMANKCKQCQRAYYARHYRENHGRELARKADYRDSNRDVLRRKSAEYASTHADRMKETAAAWREANRERQSEYSRAWRKSHPEKKRESDSRRRARKAGATHEPYSRAEIFARWGPECTYCPAPADCLDHVVPISKGGPDAPHNLVPACTPCNSSKGAKSLAEWALTFTTRKAKP